MWDAKLLLGCTEFSYSVFITEGGKGVSVRYIEALVKNIMYIV